MNSSFPFWLQKSPLLFVFSLLLLSACTPQEAPEEATVTPPTPVTLWAPDQKPAYFLKEVGVVKPFQEVEVVAKAAGVVGQLKVKVGDQVTVDQDLGKIDQSSSDPALINLSNAQNQLGTAQRSFQESISNNENVARQAKLRAENLETTLSSLKRNRRELESGNSSTESNLLLQRSNAEKNVDTAQVNINYLEDQFKEAQIDFLKHAQITFDTLLVKADSYYQTASSILNPHYKNPVNSSDFSSLIGASDWTQRNQTINLYNDWHHALNRQKEDFAALLPLSEDNFDPAFTLLSQGVNKSRELNEAMRILLQNSSASVELPQATLDGYKTKVAAAEAGSLQDLATLNEIEKRDQELQLQRNSQLATAQNNLTVTQNQLGVAQNALDQSYTSAEGSLKDLTAKIQATENDLNTAYLDYENALRTSQLQNNGKELELQTYENQVKLAQKSVEDALLQSPISGLVSEVFIDQGDYVTPGMPIARIHQRDQLKVVFYVTEKQAQWLNPNQEVTVLLNDALGTRLSGRLIQIAPTADPQSHKIKVEAAFDEALLRPEMFVSVEIEVSQGVFASRGLFVPLNAVVFAQNSQSVFVWDASIPEAPVARVRPVRTGGVVDKWVEIVEGLSASDQVIFEGSRGLEEGEPVIESL